tara:strand:+ start:97 stop:690 length:594 start_codon:yes stop_codon:yes gene_type:complete
MHVIISIEHKIRIMSTPFKMKGFQAHGSSPLLQASDTVSAVTVSRGDFDNTIVKASETTTKKKFWGGKAVTTKAVTYDTGDYYGQEGVRGVVTDGTNSSTTVHYRNKLFGGGKKKKVETNIYGNTQGFGKSKTSKFKEGEWKVKKFSNKPVISMSPETNLRLRQSLNDEYQEYNATDLGKESQSWNKTSKINPTQEY